MEAASSSEPVHDRSHSSLPFLVLAAFFTVTAFLALNDLNIYTPDSTRYLVWAKSLASFNGFLDASAPDPVRYVVHAPLYPILLVPAEWIAPAGLLAAKLTTVAFGILALYFLYGWIRKSAGDRLAFLACALVAVNPLFLISSTEVLSDVPFAAAGIALLLLVERVASTDRPSNLLLAGISIAMTACVLLREVGVAFLIGTFIFMAYRKKWRETLLIFSMPVAVYALWYFRNELVFAKYELPPLTNAKVMAAHFYTAGDASILAEWWARISSNLSAYAGIIGNLLFAPFHGWVQFDVVFTQRFPMTALSSYLDFARYPLMILFIGGAVYGLREDLRRSGTALLRIAILGCYSAVILIYPVNDLRFLLPVLLFFVYYLCAGAGMMWSKFDSRPWLGFCAGLLLFGVPNMMWDVAYVGTSARYSASPVDFYQSTVGLAKYPSHFTKPFRLVGAWLTQQTPPDAVLLSQWKDLTLWSGGRKVYAVDQNIALADFESLIRDYGLTHLVSVVQKSGAREFDLQMHATRRYAFTVRGRIANVEVYAITVNTSGERSRDSSTTYRHGVSMLMDGEYRRAGEILETARSADSMNLPVAFSLAVAKEFSMNLDDAERRFDAISAMPQSLMYTEEANIHRGAIRALRQIAVTKSEAEQSNIYLTVAGEYWKLGYRHRALELVASSIATDSTFFPAMVFGAHFSIVEGDTASAVAFCRLARNVEPDHKVTGNLTRLMDAIDTLRRTADPRRRSALYGKISSAYRDLGIIDAAIDNALLAFEEDPSNVRAMSSLGEMYAARRKWSPAGKYTRRASALDPSDGALIERLRAIEEHL